MAETTVSQHLAGLVLQAAAAPLSGARLASTLALVQHAFSVSVAGSSLSVPRSGRAAFASQSGACLVFGRGGPASAQDAAFMNAVAGHACLLEDAGPGGLALGSHPGTFIFPAALAAAQEAGASGMAFLQATYAAYEGVDALATLMPPTAGARGFRPIGLMGPFGAAAAAGVLAGLSAAQLAHALGLAANLCSGLNQGFLDGTNEPYLHPAFAARNALLAVALVRAGCNASPQSFEGPMGFFQVFAGAPGAAASYKAEAAHAPAVCRVGVKRFASCNYNQGTLALVERAGDRLRTRQEIERVVLWRPSSGANGLSAPAVAALPPYDSALQRQMSARYTLAAALLERPVHCAHWYEDAGADAACAALAARVDLRTHEAPHVHIEVWQRDGSVLHAEWHDDSALLFSPAAITAQAATRILQARGEQAAAALNCLARLPQLQSLQAVNDAFTHTA